MNYSWNGDNIPRNFRLSSKGNSKMENTKCVDSSCIMIIIPNIVAITLILHLETTLPEGLKVLFLYPLQRDKSPLFKIRCPIHDKIRCPMHDKIRCPMHDKIRCPMHDKIRCPMHDASEGDGLVLNSYM